MKTRGHQNRSARGGTGILQPQPSPLQRTLARGLEHHQAGRLAEAEAIYRQVLAAEPSHAQALHLLGVLADQCKQHEAAVQLISLAIQSEPLVASYHNDLGVAYQSLRRFEEAADCYGRALAIAPNNLDALNNRGVALQALGQLDEALLSFERSLKLRPNSPETLNRIGGLLTRLGRHDEAELRLRRALKLKPGDPEALMTLGGALLARGQLADALAACTQAVAAAPNNARAHHLLGTVQRWAGDVRAGIESYERALALSPNSANIWRNLAGVLLVAGRTADATAAYRQCLALEPTSPIAHSGLIFSLDLTPDAAEEAHAERQRWNERFGEGVQHDQPAHTNGRDPARPLRIGYVSADFCHHSAATAFMPILRAHDHAQVQVYCYSGTATPDAITAEAQALAAGWRDVAFLADEQLDALIRADEIDVLVDLSGHSAGNRLPVFARRPAPVQVTAWGYAASTGLDAMRYFLADPVVLPPEAHANYSETIINLPSVLCYEAPAFAPDVTPLPAASRGYITFGAFNRLPKMSDATLAAWGRVMAAVPTARLLLKCGGADLSPTRELLLERLAAVGISGERVTLLGSTSQPEHLAAHSEIDIMLDTFPQSGGITTLEALLMGVPVVTLLGERAPGRMSASFLTALGLDELVATTTDQYVEIAGQLTTRLDWLTEQRGALRERLLASPTGDTRAYTRAVEHVYRELWREWCAGAAD